MTRLSLLQARENPCTTCATSPCCTYVSLHAFKLRSLADLDHAAYLLNFDRLVLGVTPEGDWNAYYRYPCRFLDQRDAANWQCSVHRTPQQPNLCAHYDEYHCWYRRAFVGGELLVIDRRRLALVAERAVFDDQRDIVELPDREALAALFADVPLEADFGPAPPADPVFDRWLADAAAGTAASPPPAQLGYGDFRDPCAGCGAFCCKTLVFPYPRPENRRRVDHAQYVLGFPGLELGISDGEWQLLVRTRCRHLMADNRCGVFGRPERPGPCRTFDATGCSYVVHLGRSRPRDYLRVRLEQFAWVTEEMRFDLDGTMVAMPAMERMRELIEAGVAAAAAPGRPG